MLYVLVIIVAISFEARRPLLYFLTGSTISFLSVLLLWYGYEGPSPVSWMLFDRLSLLWGGTGLCLYTTFFAITSRNAFAGNHGPNTAAVAFGGLIFAAICYFANFGFELPDLDWEGNTFFTILLILYATVLCGIPILTAYVALEFVVSLVKALCQPNKSLRRELRAVATIFGAMATCLFWFILGLWDVYELGLSAKGGTKFISIDSAMAMVLAACKGGAALGSFVSEMIGGFKGEHLEGDTVPRSQMSLGWLRVLFFVGAPAAMYAAFQVSVPVVFAGYVLWALAEWSDGLSRRTKPNNVEALGI